MFLAVLQNLCPPWHAPGNFPPVPHQPHPHQKGRYIIGPVPCCWLNPIFYFSALDSAGRHSQKRRQCPHHGQIHETQRRYPLDSFPSHGSTKLLTLSEKAGSSPCSTLSLHITRSSFMKTPTPSPPSAHRPSSTSGSSRQKKVAPPLVSF